MITTVGLLPGSTCALTSCDQRNLIELSALREAFPILKSNADKIFFDNAATTQKPDVVLERIEEFNRSTCANAGRGTYSWSTRLSREVENSRQAIAKFLQTESEQIAFTHGATDSLNLIATMWGMHNLEDGDEVMLCVDDHASSVLPWYNVQEILRRKNVHINLIPFEMHFTGTYDRRSFERALSQRTRIVCLSHIHHLFGMEMDVAELKALIPPQVLIALDASQSAGHIKVDCASLGVDFIAFSGHKMFAANGIGILWSSRRVLPNLWPVRVGAKSKVRHIDIGSDSHFEADRGTLANLVECGTLNLPGIFSLHTASVFMQKCGLEQMSNYVSNLTLYLLDKLKKMEGIEFAPGIGVCDCTRGFGIISFRIGGVDSADIGAYLDSEGIFVKTGDQCLGRREAGHDWIRVSLQVYNTAQEIDRFIEVLDEAIHS